MEAAKKTREEYRDELTRKIVDRANSDEAFRARLKTDATQAISSELGVKLSDDIKINILEETPKNFYLVLPVQPSGAELSDDDLSALAGGQNDIQAYGCGCSGCICF